MPRLLPPEIARTLARPRWTAADARRVLAAVAHLGLSNAEFARHYDVDYQRLNAWRRRLAAAPDPDAPVTFVEVAAPTAPAPGPPARYELQLATGEVLRIEGAVEAASVGVLLTLLRGGRAC